MTNAAHDSELDLFDETGVRSEAQMVAMYHTRVSQDGACCSGYSSYMIIPF